MESLIPIINKLQVVFATTGCGQSEVQLPQIVVVGSQSSGKSSVLEGIVGRDFLPRGVGIVTRRPLVLHLHYCPIADPLRVQKGAPTHEDWALFGHQPDEIYADFQLVREEIERETERVTGSNKDISPVPITLTIYSSQAVNLSLIDLPGITKVPVGDQPPDIESTIRKMILNYISNPNSVILAVTPANQDFATSEPLKLAREVDRDGNRTLVVLTKLDLMDNGTDAMDVLTGKLVPVKLGIIGVVNRSQADIIAKKPIEDCLKAEVKFLHKKYPTLASINGIQYLSKTLNRLLMHHIRECLPQLKVRVSTMTVQCQTILRSYGDPVVDKNRTLLQIITRFSNAYNATIEGTSRNIETTELCGGARICYIFHETFSQAVDKLDPMENLSTLDILTAIRNATGPRPALFVPEVSFELLVKRQIRRLEEPSLNCVDLVYEEMLRIVQHCGFEIQQEMQRFPRLYEKINEVISTVLSNRLSPTKDFVTNLVHIQLAYINSKHPEFAADAALINVLQEAPSPFHSNAVVTERVPAQTDGTLTNGVGSEHHSATIRSGVEDISSSRHSRGTGGSGLGAWLFNRNMPPAVAMGLDNPTSTRAVEKNITRNLSTREKRDCAVIERLIKGYFVIVKKTIQDMVPKTIMNFLVNAVRDDLQSELVRQLYNERDMETLLTESDMMAQKRAESAKMLEALNKASHVIGEIRETHIW
uniref:Dynamin GTPase n=1 Tax=Globodera rostochiensis TaxID=31243 RepID=A0A914ICV1_GLORO